MLRHFLAAGSIFAFAATASAQPVPLTGEQAIKDTVAGALLEVDTPLGSKIPVRYATDGTMSGQANGSLSFFLGGASDNGRWWVSKDRLCHKWTRWFDGDLQCLRLHQSGSRIHWRRDDGETGTATIVARADATERFAQAPYALGATREPELAKPKPSIPRVARVDTVPTVRPAQPVDAKAPAKAVSGTNPVKRTDKKPTTAAPSTPAATPKPSSTRVAAAKPASQPVGEPSLPELALPPPTARDVVLETSFRVAGVRHDDVLNVRSGPSSEHGIVGFIRPEQRGVKLAGPCVEDWCIVVHRGIRGWVNRYYLVEDTTVRSSAWPAWTPRDLR